jgi:hypothetical protein
MRGGGLQSQVLAASERFDLDREPLAITLGVLVALKIAILFIFSWNRRIVMDEFVQFGFAKYISNGLYVTVWPGRAMGGPVFFYPAHLIGWNARSMLLLGRMEMALLACGTLAIVYASARSLGHSKARTVLELLILLSFSNFIERIFELRGDPLSVFFAAAALLAVLRGRERGLWIVAAGVLSGLAFLSTQKAVYFNFALGVALAVDAALARNYREAIARGAGLVFGWLVPIAVYCLAFGGTHPLAVAHALFFGPAAVMSPNIPDEYGGLRGYVIQTLARNVILYLFCFGGILLALARIMRLEGRKRIALIFTIVITILVFAHNQPWPYVFIMALPFMALWSLEPFDALAAKKPVLPAAAAVLGVAILASFVANIRYFRIDNHRQLDLVTRAEKLLGPREVYFDGVGMLPNRPEPSTLWLDHHAVLLTLHEGQASEAYRIFASSAPKLILWSYRMDSVEPVTGPLIRDSYVQVAPNIRLAGVRLRLGQARVFRVPIGGQYSLYDNIGRPLEGDLRIGNMIEHSPVWLARGAVTVVLQSGPREALLVPKGDYSGIFQSGEDDPTLFAGVYD